MPNSMVLKFSAVFKYKPKEDVQRLLDTPEYFGAYQVSTGSAIIL